MVKTLKYTLIAIGAVVGAIVLAIAVFIATLDPNRYKGDAEAAVKQASGRDLAIEGDLELQVFPWLALRTGKVTLGNAAGFEGPFLTLTGARAQVKVMPLLQGEVEIGEVVFEDADLRLEVDAEGRDNWSDLAKMGGGGDADGAERKPGPHFSIAGLEFQGARLAYRDARDGSAITVSDLQLRTTAIEPGSPFSVEGKLGFKVAGVAEGTPLAGTLRYATTILPGSALRVTNLVLGLDATGGPLPAPLKGGVFTAKQLVFGEPLRFEGVHIEAWGLALDGTLTRAAEKVGTRTTGTLQLAPFKPREVLPRFGIEVPVTADPQALTSLSGALTLDHLGDQLKLDDLKLKLDQSTLSGRLALESIERKALRFDLVLDTLDTDRYLPPPADEPLELGGLDAVALDVGWLRGLDVVGTLKAGKLALTKFDLADLRLGIDARDGRLWIKPFGAALYGGKVQGEVVIDARGEQPAGKILLDLAGVRIHDLLDDAVGSKLVSGVATLRLDLSGSGATVGALKKDLDGTISFSVEDGALENFNVWKQARLAWAKYKSRATSAASDPDRTEFERFQGGATLSDGVATLEGVRAAIRFAEATAKGKIDLGKATIQVTAQAKVNAVPDFGPDEKLKELNGVTLPVAISGPFGKPKVDVDMVKAAASMLKPDLLKDDKLKKKLKGLFG